MARLNVGSGLDNYLAELGNLEFYAHDQIGKAIYIGARIVTNSIASSIDAIPKKEGKHAGGVTGDQRRGLKKGLGIAKARNDNGLFNVKVGFDGYNTRVTKSFPKGQPNAMIARSLEKGTSFAPKTPFVNKAVKKVKTYAEQKMQKTLDEEIKKIMK